jgi:hypothetical protein
VLHLLNRSLHLHIGPGFIQGILLPAWTRETVLAKAKRTFSSLAQETRFSSHGESVDETYRAAAESVIVELASTASAQKARLHVVLADSWVHYDVVAGDYAASSDRQLQAIADACIIEVLGDRAINQVVRWQLQPDKQHLFISSIDTKAIDGLVQVASRVKLRLHSLQTEFCTQWNLHAQALPNGTGVFSVVSESQLVVVYSLRGSIIALSSAPAERLEDTSPAESPTYPIDVLADRLLTCIGHDPKDNATYLLVASEQSPIHDTSRWTVIRPAEELV